MRRLLGWFLVLVAAAGCRHAHQKVTPLPAPSAPVVEEVPRPEPTRGAEPAPVPEPVPAPAPLPEPRIRRTAATDWIPCERWAEECGLKPPVVQHSATNASVTFRELEGVLTLTMGRQPARWKGVEVWLGHAPRWLQGKPSIHGLDANCTLWPLLTDVWPALTTNRVIVIDPGHGGSNPGASNVVNGKAEKEFTLDWALRLRPLLEQQGWQVHLTRTNDVEVSLPDRVAIADSNAAGLFVSLHFNHASTNGQPAGIETYCLTPAGLPSTVTRGQPDDLREVVPNHAFDADNLRLAYRVQAALVRGTGGVDGGVRRARFMGVLRGQRRPAILIEGGYLSNRAEARRIASPEHRQRLAEAVAAGLSPGPEASPPMADSR